MAEHLENNLSEKQNMQEKKPNDNVLTPRKIEKFLQETCDSDSDLDEEDDVGDLYAKNVSLQGPLGLTDFDLSAESEVFDSDRDPDYYPSDSDYNNFSSKPISKRLFEQRFERQLDIDKRAGCSFTVRHDISSEESEYDKPIKKKPSKKRKKPAKQKTVVKKIKTKHDRNLNGHKDKNQQTLDTEKEVVKDRSNKNNDKTDSKEPEDKSRNDIENQEIEERESEEGLLDEESRGDDNLFSDEDESQVENTTKTKEKKKRKFCRHDEYSLKVFGTEKDIKWEDWQGRQKPFTFTGQSGINPDISGELANGKPIDYFMQFLDEDIINLMVDETNLYATQTITNDNDVLPQSRLHDWQPTDAVEMRKFIGLLGWMGLVKFQNLRDYWSKNMLYDIPLARNTMSRNRFELLLKMWHFSDNTMAGTNRLFKIENLLNMFIKRFKEAYTPGNTVCIDESMIPWRGRLVFRQYNPRKRHRYGIKLYKVCASKGYTWNFSVYVGQDLSPDYSAAENVIYKLLGGLLDNGKGLVPGGLLGEGRLLITDNWYTSVPLALGLLEHSTHLVGTLRTDRKYLPPAASTALKKGEIVTKETEEGITFLKWKDKREVCVLSTVHANETVDVTTKTNRVVTKPKDIVLYNSGKFSIDMSDQMATYGKALRRCTKWYRKLVVEVIWGMVLVNSHFLYNLNSSQEPMPIKKFRETVITSLLLGQSRPATPRRIKGVHHLIEKLQGDPPKKKRGRCKLCYEECGRKGQTDPDGKKKMAKQVYTICDSCDGQPFMCRSCFNKKH